MKHIFRLLELLGSEILSCHIVYGFSKAEFSAQSCIFSVERSCSNTKIRAFLLTWLKKAIVKLLLLTSYAVIDRLYRNKNKNKTKNNFKAKYYDFLVSNSKLFNFLKVSFLNSSQM